MATGALVELRGGFFSPAILLRRLLLLVYTWIFVMCLIAIGVSLYYLAALALNSFGTSGVFTGILAVSTVLLVSSVWGCHRTKDVRSHRNEKKGIAFLVLLAGIWGSFLAFTVITNDNYNLMVEIQSKPLVYWDEHLGEESDMLLNFAMDFFDMWQSGWCEGNKCEVDGCADDPIALSPLRCDDEGMQAQFRSLISKYSGSQEELRICHQLLVEIMASTENPDLIDDFPIITWCQSRSTMLQYAQMTIRFMFWIDILLTISLGISIPLMWLYVFLIKKLMPDLHTKAWTPLFESRFFKSLKSEDEEIGALQFRQHQRATRTMKGSLGSLDDATDIHIP
jgi:hypothetical protein